MVKSVMSFGLMLIATHTYSAGATQNAQLQISGFTNAILKDCSAETLGVSSEMLDIKLAADYLKGTPNTTETAETYLPPVYKAFNDYSSKKLNCIAKTLLKDKTLGLTKLTALASQLRKPLAPDFLGTDVSLMQDAVMNKSYDSPASRKRCKNPNRVCSIGDICGVNPRVNRKTAEDLDDILIYDYKSPDKATNRCLKDEFIKSLDIQMTANLLSEFSTENLVGRKEFGEDPTIQDGYAKIIKVDLENAAIQFSADIHRLTGRAEPGATAAPEPDSAAATIVPDAPPPPQ